MKINSNHIIKEKLTNMKKNTSNKLEALNTIIGKIENGEDITKVDANNLLILVEDISNTGVNETLQVGVLINQLQQLLNAPQEQPTPKEEK